MSYALRYRSTRKEVWRWYWAMWRAKLWRVHVLLGVCGASFAAFSAASPCRLTWALVSFVAAVPVITLLSAVWPQMAFKGQERALDIGSDGYSTQIGHFSGARTWGEVASVAESHGTLVIASKNGNVLIIPQRALPNLDSWQQFIRDAQAWYQAHAV